MWCDDCTHLLCLFRSAPSLLHWRPNYGINNNHTQPHTHTHWYYDVHTLCPDVTAADLTHKPACLCTIHWGDLWIFYQNWPNCLTIHVACPLANGGREERACHNCHKNNRQRRQRSSSSDTSLVLSVFINFIYPQVVTVRVGVGGKEVAFKWKRQCDKLHIEQ